MRLLSSLTDSDLALYNIAETSQKETCAATAELSQNHRMVGVGRDLCGSCSPTPLPKQGHLQQAAQDLVQVGLELSPEKETAQPPWAACSRALSL